MNQPVLRKVAFAFKDCMCLFYFLLFWWKQTIYVMIIVNIIRRLASTSPMALTSTIRRLSTISGLLCTTLRFSPPSCSIPRLLTSLIPVQQIPKPIYYTWLWMFKQEFYHLFLFCSLYWIQFSPIANFLTNAYPA